MPACSILGTNGSTFDAVVGFRDDPPMPSGTAVAYQLQARRRAPSACTHTHTRTRALQAAADKYSVSAYQAGVYSIATRLPNFSTRKTTTLDK